MQSLKNFKEIKSACFPIPRTSTLLFNCFSCCSRDARKNAFLQKARSLGVIIRAVFKLGDGFMRFEFPFGRRGKLGLLRVFLITTASSASPAVDIFFCVERKCFCWGKIYPSIFLRMNFLDTDLEWWLLVVGIREYNSAAKKTVRYFQTTSCNLTAFFPIDTMHFYPLTEQYTCIASPSIYKQIVYFRKSSHTEKTGKCIRHTILKERFLIAWKSLGAPG